jgi:hypothetical protein
MNGAFINKVKFGRWLDLIFLQRTLTELSRPVRS